MGGKNEKMERTKEVLFMKIKKEKYYCMQFVGGQRGFLKNELVYVESFGRKVYFQMLSDQCVAYRKLDEVEKELADDDFLRIHQSYLVNMSFIDDIYGYEVYLKSGLSLPVPRTRYRDVRESFLYWRDKYILF